MSDFEEADEGTNEESRGGPNIVDDPGFSEKDVIGLLAGLAEIRAKREQYAKAYETGKAPIADYLLRHGGVLRDGEAGLIAEYRSGGQEEHLDFKNLLDAALGSEALEALARRGLLRLDAAAFKRQEKEFQQGATVRRYIYQTPKTERLMIERER